MFIHHLVDHPISTARRWKRGLVPGLEKGELTE